jgi:hypothetical protein
MPLVEKPDFGNMVLYTKSALGSTKTSAVLVQITRPALFSGAPMSRR